MIGKSQAFRACRAVMLLISLMPLLLIPQSLARADEAADHAAEIVRGLTEAIWSSRERADPADVRKQWLVATIEDSTSIDLLSRLALGKHWRSLPEVDRQEYQTLFSKVVIGDLVGRLDGLLRELDGSLEQRFFITKSLVAGKNDVLVRSKVIAADGRPLSLDWRVRDLDSGPVIIDLIVEGVSLLVSQRAEFASVIERSQIQGLIDALRDRARSGAS